MKHKNFKLVTKVIAGAVFAALFVINATSFVQKGDKTSSNLSLTGLVASASADAEGGGTTMHGQTCGKDECTVTLGIGGTSVSASGHYFHCQTTTVSSQTCNSSSCTTSCDAVIHV